MSFFGCCFWWLLLGVFVGWLLNYFLCRCSKNKTKDTVSHYTPPPAPAAKESPTPSAAPVNKVASPSPAKPKASPVKKSPAKPKAKSTESKSIDLAAAKAAGIKIKSIDDLTVIEGIGPKINDLFKQNNLKTFADVASATVPQMRKVLDSGGARFRIANPSTWAKQAKLAAANKWVELKKLQDELSGGVKK